MEVPAERTIADVNKDYNNICAQLGAANYQLEVMKTSIAQMVQKINELNKEAQALDAAKTPTEAAPSEQA